MSADPWLSSGRLCLALLAVLALGACSQLQPLDLPDENALPTSESDFWRELHASRDDEWFYLLNEGAGALDWRLRLIDAATVSVDMDTFLWKPDSSGLAVFNRLLAAADRGVRVRILLDDSFTMHEDLMLHALAEHPLISVRIYNPFRHRSDNVALRQLLNLGDFPRINHRMHNKTLVVDGQLAIVGGRNLGDEYFGRHQEMNFRDMEVIASGSQIPQVSLQFDAFWNSGWAFPISKLIEVPSATPGLGGLRSQLDMPVENAPKAQSPDDTWRQMVAVSLPGSAEFYFDNPADHNPAERSERPDQLALKLRELISAADSDVWLITAYLVPTNEMEAVVEEVEGRGVRVRVLTNSLSSNNHVAAHAAYRDHLGRLLEHGADLHEVKTDARDRHEYMETPLAEKKLGLHAKVLLIDDDIVFIGSSNLDRRSLKLNTEVGLVIRGREFNRYLREKLSVDFDPANAWAVRKLEDGDLQWVSDTEILRHQPAESFFQRLEDWLIGFLPIDSQM